MKYAPISITTLNRYEHLEKCITSLKKNPAAKHTELYISVDYPPSEKYQDGYHIVKNYLDKGVNGFKQVHIFYQENNLGPLKNDLFLKNIIFKNHDCIICLEDDNEVSPCFLDYCNKGLELFKNNTSIAGINASSYVWCGKDYIDIDKTNNSSDNNVMKRQLLFHAFATWKESWDEVFSFCETKQIYKYGKNFPMMLKLRKISSCFFYHFIDRVLTSSNRLPWYEVDKIYPIDSVWDFYMMFHDKYMICPKTSLMRDLGVDGSGVNYDEKFVNADVLINKKINDDTEFDFIMTHELEEDTYEIMLHDKNGYNLIRSRLKLIFKYFIYLFKQ